MDKTLLKVSGIISIVLGVLACITIVGVIIGIPLIIGGNKLREYSLLSDKEILEKKSSILIWTIVFLFINQLSGIFSLIFYIQLEEGLSKSNKKSNVSFAGSKYDDLERVKKLYDDKVLTAEEYEKEKNRILNS